MPTILGIITAISFRNEDSGFTVLQLQTRSSSPEKIVTCVGLMPVVSPGESIQIQGEWENHKRFGSQLAVKNYELIRPTTREGIEMLLGSGLIDHIGPVRAKKILDTFGLEALDIMDNMPDRLQEVPGIGKKFTDKIKEAWDRRKHLSALMLFLQEFGVSINMAQRIYKAYGVHAKEKISQNPYALVDDVWGIGFAKADNIARKMGYTHDSYKRIKAGLTFIMQEAANEGHSFLPREELVARAVEVLQVKEEQVTFSVDHVLETGYLKNDDGCIYLTPYYNAEKFIADALHERLNAGVKNKFQDSQLSDWIEDYRKKRNWTGDQKQLEAVKLSVNSGVFLLTGGPGTGKTTVLQVIVSFFKDHQISVALAAPTGRAAQRMGNLAGLTAQTIHRLLEFKGGPEGYSFNRNERNPIEADVIILDEVSMVDVLLMRNFLSAVKPGSALIFVGDDNQLPSVGAGNVLSDLIAGKVIPHVRLTTIFRQAASSRIVTTAHEIIGGEVPSFANGKSDDCFFINQDDPAKCVTTIVDLVSRRLPASYGFNPISDIQVLSPMHKGELGTQNLNEILQKTLNGNSRKIIRGQSTYFLGDKVMQIRNNYDLGVFNGDIGTVKDIIVDEGLMVDFDGVSVKYDLKELDELVPAYCISIHKSQGCEFKAVVISLMTQHFIMLQRNLIYTALTRAKKLCIIVGNPKALAIAIKNDKDQKRYSKLGIRLREKSIK